MGNVETARIILDQMGGTNRLRIFVSASGFAASKSGVSFKFKGCKNMNCVEIKLNIMDTYDVTFYKEYAFRTETKKKFFGIYSDGLQRLFTETTGLCLKL